MAAPRGIAWERSFSGGKESGDFFQLLSVRRLVDDSLLAVVREGYGASAIRFGLGGTVLSNATFFSAGLVYSAVADPFGSVVLVTQIPASASTYDVVIMKYDGLTGMKVWPGSARIRGVLFQGPPAAAIGPSGDVFVTAGVFGAALGSIDWATVCYDGRTGNILWGPAVYGDSMSYPRSAGPVDLTIDPSGDIVVIGFATPSDRSLWAAIKYRGATGEQIWGPVLIGAVSTAPPPTVCPGSCYSPPTFAKCAFDRNGNVFLAVSSFTAPYGQAWLTAKYGGATGSPIWGPVSHKTGTETDYDVPSAIGVNGNGDVVVGGSVLPSPYSNGGNFVSELVKYSSASGERIWGPFQVPSTAAALAFDGGGQVIVTGDGSTSSFDGRSGRKLWQENFGSAQAKVVVGSDGNVTSLAGAYVGFGLDQHPELQAV
ncbi:MAG TPA: PQQ-binding-like beta-propeller repeat protein, partial [Thermoanaerobaculia bacterium]|nr:PQQ-binding-like beta-propeller repeat protein [Thermoanaerobaculia bacterium]